MKISKKVLSSFDIDIFKICNFFSFILFHDCVYKKIEGLGFGEWTFEFLMIFVAFINECFSLLISFVKYAESALFFLNICFSPSLKLNKKTFFSLSSNRLMTSIIISLTLYKSLLSNFFSLGPCVFYALTSILTFANSDFMKFVPVHLFTADDTSANFKIPWVIFWHQNWLFASMTYQLQPLKMNFQSKLQKKDPFLSMILIFRYKFVNSKE